MSSLEKFTLQLYITTENPMSFTSFTIFHEFILREGILKLSGAPPSESSQTVPQAQMTSISGLLVIMDSFLLEEVNLLCLCFRSFLVIVSMVGMEITYKFLVSQPLLYVPTYTIVLKLYFLGTKLSPSLF